MKMPFRFLSLFFLFLSILSFHSGVAQLVPNTPEEKQAVELVKAYQAELGMTVEQASAMYKKISDNLVLSKEIKASKKTEEEKKKYLTNIQEQETAYMETILESKQFREYKKMKKTLQ